MPLSIANTTVTADFVEYGGGSNYGSGWILVFNGFVEVRLLHGKIHGQANESPAYMLPAGVTPLAAGSRPDIITGFEIRALNGAVTSPPQQFAAALFEPGLAGLVPTTPFPATIDSGGTVNPCPCGGGGGGTTLRKLLVSWGGLLPVAGGSGQVWAVPFDTDGTPFAFTLARAFGRLESPPGAGTTQLTISSSPGGSTFVPTAVTTLVFGAGAYEVTNTGIAVAVTSGNLLRIDYTQVPVGANTNFAVELEGSQ